MHVSASQLKGNNRCFQRRERNFTLASDKNDVYKRSGIMKAAIKNFFISLKLDGKESDIRRIYTDYIKTQKEYEDVPDEDKEIYRYVRTVLKAHDELIYSYTEDDVVYIVEKSKEYGYIKNYISDAFVRRLSFPTETTAEIQAESAYELCARYLRYETREPIIPETKEMDLFGVTVDIKPDFVFRNIDGSIEAVKICCKLPDVTNGGEKKDRAKNKNMELYALWRYARSLIENDTDIVDVKASFYFLRRKDDSKERLQPAFSEPGASNIVTLDEKVTRVNKAKLDVIFRQQFFEYIAGEECSGETCKTCDFCKLCEFSKAPSVSEAEKPMRKVSDIDLSPSQEEAVYFRKGIVRINAGAGVGKTLVVALRTAIMLSEGVAPEDILLITFTNAGADEMRERIAMYDSDLGTGTDMSRLMCLTFNAFGDMAIKEKYKELGFESEPRLIDDIERKSIITELLNEYEIPGIDYKNFFMSGRGYNGAFAVASKAFELIKKERLSSYDDDVLKDLLDNCEGNYGNSIDDTRAYSKLLSLYDEFDDRLRSKCLIEYLDQERLLFDILAMDPYYFDNFGFKHIIIDEAQDTSKSQMELVKMMINTKSFESLMAVGDDSQSIFSFRDADSQGFIEFFDRLDVEGKDIYIVDNHRSTPEILDFANDINRKNEKRIDKDLKSTRESGKKPIVKGFHTVKEEYQYIADLIKEKLLEDIAPEDIAVIAYTRKELIQIQGVLSDNGIETSLQCPEPMLDNSRVQGLISLCHMLKDMNATQDIAIYENCLMEGGFLKKSDDEINDIIAKRQKMISEFHHKSYDEKLDIFDKMSREIVGDDEVAENLRKRLDPFQKLGDKFDYIDMFNKFEGENLKRNSKYSGVVLSTAHSSKGLEYKVIINSITKYDSPHLSRKSKRGIVMDEVEEHRRLFFVSATRAKDELYITGQYSATCFPTSL